MSHHTLNVSSHSCFMSSTWICSCTACPSGSVRCGNDLQLPEDCAHPVCEPVPGAPADLPGQDDHGHPPLGRPLCPRQVQVECRTVCCIVSSRPNLLCTARALGPYCMRRIIDWPHRIKRWQNRKVWFLIRLHIKEALLRHIEESSSRREGRVSSRRQIV